MTKVVCALLAGALAFIPPLALADDSAMKPLPKMEAQEARVAREAAKAQWVKMTPDEQVAAKKVARSKRQVQLTALDEVAMGPVTPSGNPISTTPSGTPMVGDFDKRAPMPPAMRQQ